MSETVRHSGRLIQIPGQPHGRIIVRVSGLPGSGKTTLGDELGKAGVLFTDVDRKRKEVFGDTGRVLPPMQEKAQMAESYQRMYDEAARNVSERGMAAIGATFKSHESRIAALDFARQQQAALLSVALIFPDPQIEEDIIRRRLELRKKLGSESNIETYAEYLRVKAEAVPYDDGQTMLLDASRPSVELAHQVVRALSDPAFRDVSTAFIPSFLSEAD